MHCFRYKPIRALANSLDELKPWPNRKYGCFWICAGGCRADWPGSSSGRLTMAAALVGTGFRGMGMWLGRLVGVRWVGVCCHCAVVAADRSVRCKCREKRGDVRERVRFGEMC
jgi:hypothetical protein